MNIDNNKYGTLGEAKALVYLIENDYTVFTQFDGKAPFDMVAYKDNTLFRVSVKSTRQKTKSGNWFVELRQIRSNTNKIIHHFDNSTVDILLVYIVDEDKIILIDPKTINIKSGLTLPSSKG